jgi:molybdopterin synthase sulfur carrier subunit
MKLTIHYFGMIAELTGTAKADFELSGNDVSELKEQLEKTFPALRGMSYKIAVNQKLALSKTQINQQDELAVLPPFAGG